jgi:polyisoprenoid-binding protein YceI
MLRTFLAAAGLALLAAAPAAAQPAAFQFDKSHTQIYFSIDHFGFSATHGLFREFDGALVLDEARPESSRVTFTIQAASIDTQFAQRDTHIRSADFLDTARFPTIGFVSTRVEPTGEGTARVHGDLTIKGVTRPAVLNVKLNKLAPSPITQQPTAGFTAETVIRRTEWGISTYAPAIGDEIRVRIDAEAFRAS